MNFSFVFFCNLNPNMSFCLTNLNLLRNPGISHVFPPLLFYNCLECNIYFYWFSNNQTYLHLLESKKKEKKKVELKKKEKKK